MKLLSWNVNGIRACVKKGFFNWFDEQKADIVCIQETKAQEDQLDSELMSPFGYQSFWHSAQKKGYSGVATYCREEPINVRKGIGVAEIDNEGRVLITEFKDFFLINCYFPNSQREHTRLPYKLNFCGHLQAYCEHLKSEGKNVIVCGDYNVAHTEIDIANPDTNRQNAGFLPEEREWMTGYLSKGFVDVFRKFHEGNGHYTWWSYRPGVRERNVGWRIDYHTVNEEFSDRVKSASHHTSVMGSDHCPVELVLKD